MSLPKEKMVEKNYNMRVAPSGTVIKLWNKHVTIEEAALKQLDEVASMPFVKPFVAAMPDTHWGMGATVGSVIPTVGAIMPAAVGVDIGCGMMAVRTNLKLDKEDSAFISSPVVDRARNVLSMQYVFDKISKAVPHGRTNNGGPGDRGAWDTVPEDIQKIWNDQFYREIHGSHHSGLSPFSYDTLFRRHPGALSKNAERQFGTLGTGNHFIEVCTEIDNPDSNLWVVIHSGSRGFGNRIGTYFTKLAGELCKKWGVQLPNRDLGYLPVSTPEYDDYLAAVQLAQKFAWVNREIMMQRVLDAIGASECSGDRVYGNDGDGVPDVIHMHHNYAEVQGERILTRKGAVDASKDKWCVIPGSMGAKTYIGRGLGNPESFNSCSHGAGRAMSRTAALKTFTVADHVKATEGVFCDKTEGTIDETPAAYKPIEDVMESQRDLVEPILKIKQLVCIKGLTD
jgi:tRNA-splicing ligase RtcB (3'-phosphate/5'-hydroxy nucleic acid ligase)